MREWQDALAVRRKKTILELAQGIGNVSKTCREYQVPRASFYRWRAALAREGIEGLRRKRPVAKKHPRQLSAEVVHKILDLRRQYHLGPQRITWYLERYHGITTSCSTVYRTLIRNGVGRLPKTVGRRAVHTRRYSKKVPGHHVQVAVAFLWLTGRDGRKVRRYQYTAIDDATRIRALRVYSRHNQKSV